MLRQTIFSSLAIYYCVSISLGVILVYDTDIEIFHSAGFSETIK